MKFFEERNPLPIGVIGIVTVVVLALAALQYKSLPFFNSGSEYSAYFAEAGGLTSGAAVQVSGLKVGEVLDVGLDGPRVLVTFRVEDEVTLGDRSEAAIKARTLLGAKILEVTPRGDGSLGEPIPLQRTTSPYQLADALGDLGTTLDGLDTDGLTESLGTLSQAFTSTPPALQAALAGLGRFSEVIGERDTEVRTLLANAARATGVLGQRTDQIVDLVRQTDALLTALLQQQAALDGLSGHISALAAQLSGVVAEQRSVIGPALEKVNGVLGILDNRKQQIQSSLTMLNAYQMSLGEAVSSGPFFNAYVANLLPGQFIQPFVDAAFSDLGLDPAVLAPSELSDPQTGQPGTPALPVPYPRTGQGGPPNLTLPEAITGVPGSSRYPFVPPPPAPAPGGPPPGPPAQAPGGGS
ncbi:MCE family protein [Mycobacterium manitobense]|uniref:MCE family protein n=1 Tax=[Mycobacterium] manitobense TaxID=190147 RepID=A0A9X3BVS7_9MYCO|nr:MCE family protein [[Mycobacterium] manitobense]MCV7169592.1 MCE family protein [[Mycobacterium] manitobense]